MLRSPKVYDDLGGLWIREERLRQQWRKSIYPVLEVNDRPLIDHSRYSYNLQELLLSKKRSGLYQIITHCGSFDGYKDTVPQPVMVTHHDAHITWQLTAPGLPRLYHFEKRQYRETMESLKVELRTIMAEYHTEIREGSLHIHPIMHTEKYPFIQDLAKKYRIYDYEFNFQG